jgi:hypothetical protein
MQIVAFAKGFGAVTSRGKANGVRHLRGSLERGPDLRAWFGAPPVAANPPFGRRRQKDVIRYGAFYLINR